MSGFAAVLNLDGAPLRREVIEGMTGYLAFRGPDAQRVHVSHHVGLGHALLRTTDEAEREAQPCTVDGRWWIVADARVDARADLVAALIARGQNVASDA